MLKKALKASHLFESPYMVYSRYWHVDRAFSFFTIWFIMGIFIKVSGSWKICWKPGTTYGYVLIGKVLPERWPKLQTTKCRIVYHVNDKYTVQIYHGYNQNLINRTVITTMTKNYEIWINVSWTCPLFNATTWYRNHWVKLAASY